MREHLASGLIPWWVPLVYLGTGLLAVISLFLMGPLPKDEIEHWKHRTADNREERIFDF